MGAAAVAPKLCELPPFELFAAGLHRGEWYTLGDLDRVVANFHRFAGANGEAIGCKVNPPIVLGHSDEQTLLEDSGLPAAGIITNLWRDGSKLIGVPGDVPELIGRLINQRAYRTVSAEFWPNFVDGQGKSWGLTLRRVALLGGEVPQVKSLADLPLAKFSDRPAVLRTANLRPARMRRTPRGTVVCFCDVQPVAVRLRHPGYIRLGRRTLVRGKR
jgi:hypothetical protein